MRTFHPQQKRYLLGLIVIILLSSFVSYLQFYKGVVPCPLCILQRFTMGFLAAVFLTGFIFASKRWRQMSIGLLSFLTCVLGIFLSGRQVWLQSLPANSGADCEVSLEYMLQALPLKQVLQKVVTGGANCSAIEWEFLHISLAGWSLLCFILFALFSLFQIKHKP